MRRLALHGGRALALMIMVLGAALIASTLARGGGSLTIGVVLGVLFVALGAGRLLLTRGLGPDR